MKSPFFLFDNNRLPPLDVGDVRFVVGNVRFVVGDVRKIVGQIRFSTESDSFDAGTDGETCRR
ncbi:protein of unknown function (plasmid) [Shinella sp. WSC3-e]|nr:hypothetical protein SHINE37_80037 [Rhizobiaceae bacterium]CAK7261961.1 protein of unknown function [Shinella sp. WSC3-e]